MKLATTASALSTVMSLSFFSAVAAPNQPPLACFTLTPGSGNTSTVFQADASCSTDDKTAPSKLKVRWDWETDGIWDTVFTTVKTASHQYGIPGPKTLTLQVQDAQGLLGTNAPTVAVLPADTVRIGTGMTEPDIDVNPLNPSNIVFRPIMNNVLTGGTVPYPSLYSNDGGANWTRATGPGPYQVTDPVTSFDRLGAVFFGGLSPGEFGPSIHRGIIVARSTDGGATFATPVYAMSASTVFTFPDGSTGTPCGTGTFFDYEKMDADKGAVSPYQNNIYLTTAALNLDKNNDGVCDTGARVIVRSTDGGATWGAAQAFVDFGTFVHSVAIGRDGAVYLPWGGVTATGGPCPGLEGVVFRVSRNGGASFEPPVCAYNSDGSLRSFATYAAADPNDAQRLWIAFSAAVTGLDNSYHIFVIGSTDGGASWSQPQRIDEVLPPDDLVDHILPSLSVSSTGRLDLVWIDYRNSTSKRFVQNRQTADLFYSSSTDGGTTWAAPRSLSGTSPFLFGAGNDFVTVTSSGNKAYAAYSVDFDRDGTWEGMVTTVTFP